VGSVLPCTSLAQEDRSKETIHSVSPISAGITLLVLTQARLAFRTRAAACTTLDWIDEMADWGNSSDIDEGANTHTELNDLFCILSFPR